MLSEVRQTWSDIALHEAAHVVVSISLGGTLHTVTIRPAGEMAGRYWGIHPKPRVAKLAMFLAAGIADQTLNYGTDPRTSSRDLAMAEAVLEGARHPDVLRARAVALASKALRANHDVLFQMAARLTQLNTLTPEDCDDLLRRIVFVDDKI